MSDEEAFDSPNRKPAPPRRFRDDEQAGAGGDVQLLENGELLVSQRCITGDAARYVAQVFKNDHLRQGWTE